MKRTCLGLAIILAVALGCDTSDSSKTPQQPTLPGNWKFTTEQHVACTNSSDNEDESCAGTASQCGVLSLTESTWLYSRVVSPGTIFSEGGAYSVTSNVITLTGGSGTPNSLVYSISGSMITFSLTTLVFKSSSTSTGCSITIAFAKHNQPFNPID